MLAKNPSRDSRVENVRFFYFPILNMAAFPKRERKESHLDFASGSGRAEGTSHPFRCWDLLLAILVHQGR